MRGVGDMCYTVIWLDTATNEPFYSQEIADNDRKSAWTQIAARSRTHRILALVPGHHAVIFNKNGGLTDAYDCVTMVGNRPQ
jgi:hypothetical protein